MNRCDWVDWKNGPYLGCGKPAVIQVRGTWLCRYHDARHLEHLAAVEYPRISPDCWCLVALSTRFYRDPPYTPDG